MKHFFRVLENNKVEAADNETNAFISRRKVGDVFGAKTNLARNYKFHQKMFTLFILVHDNMPEPEKILYKGKWIKPLHNLDTTRKYLTVKAGYYDVIGLPNGKVRIEAQSISYEKMEPDEFENMYRAVIDVAFKMFPKGWTENDRDLFCKEVLRYA